jgi:hypothetical protein
MAVAVAKEASNPVRAAAVKVAKAEESVRTPHLAVSLSGKMLHRVARKKAEHLAVNVRKTKAELETVQPLLFGRKRSK